jgi:2-enoate reductase
MQTITKEIYGRYHKMETDFVKILEPTKIGSVEIKNRIAMAPMGNFCLTNPDGSFGQRAIDYFIERARGGVGLIITGICKVENEIEPVSSSIVPVVTRASLASFMELTEAVHALGSKIFVQLTAGFGRVGHPSILSKSPIAPSAIPNYWIPSITCRELTTEEVEHYVKCFGDAAEIVKEAGVDGVEIHAVHEGYLLDQFTISMFNRRSDKYGGDLAGRLTFPVEIVREIKKRAGETFPVSLRFSLKSFIKDWRQGGLAEEEFEEKGRDVEEGLESAKMLEAAGYDSFNADCGSYDGWYWAHPPVYQKHGCLLPYVSKLKDVLTVPVMAAGRLGIPELAEKALADGQADIISIGRALLTDPYWVRKVENNRTEHIRPCIGCHDGCLGRIFLARPLSCAVNPTVGRENLYRLQRADIPKKVMVIGGGVAGMETVRVAVQRGHKVTLYEKSDNLGGHLIEASVPEFKNDLERLLNWYKVELDDIEFDAKLGEQVTTELIEEEKPDAVVIATGSVSRIPDIPGIKNDKVATDIDLLLGNKKAGKKVVIAGGGMIGCETALWLAQEGKEVTIIEELPELMAAGKEPIPHANRIMLLDLLKLHCVTLVNGFYIAEVTDDGVGLVSHNFERKQIEADTVAISIGLRPNREIYDNLVGKIPYIYLIGDARAPRNVMGSIWDAYEVARSL